MDGSCAIFKDERIFSFTKNFPKVSSLFKPRTVISYERILTPGALLLSISDKYP